MSRRSFIFPKLYRAQCRFCSSFPKHGELGETYLERLNALKLESNPNILLQKAEIEESLFGGPDFACLHAVMKRSIELFPNFNPGQFVELLALFSRFDFVDSSLSLAVQAYLPSVVGTFGSSQYPILFCSLLRLGIDQPVERVSIERSTVAPPSPTMEALVGEIVRRLSEISGQHCLMMLHSIVRRGRSRMSPEMHRLALAISEHPSMEIWSLPLTIQLVHALSRVGIENDQSVAKLFSLCRQSISSVPSPNLQQLLSIIYNHSSKHDRDVWEPVLKEVLKKISRVAKTMTLPTLAVTLGYLGRLPCEVDASLFESVLSWFLGGKRVPNLELATERILSDPGLDIAHLAAILESAQKILHTHDLLFNLTVNLALREGVHNVKAMPLCQMISYALTRGTSNFKLQDEHINSSLERKLVRKHWTLKTPLPNAAEDISTILLEGLLRHEHYIKSNSTATLKCLEIKKILPKNTSKNVQEFFDSLHSDL